MHAVTVAPSGAVERHRRVGARSAGLRIGVLYGPAVYGVLAAGVALPAVSSDLHAAPASAAWVLTAYAWALGVSTALVGRLSDRWGPRSTLRVSALLLGCGALACLLAPGLGMLIAGRIVLAAGSGAVISTALSLAAAADPSDRPRVLASYGGTIAVFAASATLAGGLVTTALSWRVTMVLPALSLLAVPACMPLAAKRGGSARPVDVAGAAMLAVLAAAALVLIQASVLDLPLAGLTVTALVMVLAAASLYLRMRHRPDGFVPRLVTSGTFIVCAALGAGVYAALFAALSTAPYALAHEHGWSVLAVGVALLPGAAAGAVLSRVAGRADGPRLLAATAGAFALTLGAAAASDGSPYVLAAGAALGFAAFATTQVVLTGYLSARIPPAQRSAALSVLALTFFMGGAAGSAAAGALSQPLGTSGALAVVAVLPLISAALALVLNRPARRPAGPGAGRPVGRGEEGGNGTQFLSRN